MLITCKVLPIFNNMVPILSATSPLTPVSISSKMIVGNCFFVASNDFKASIKRDSSPPLATLCNSFKEAPLLALNKNLIWLKP